MDLNINDISQIENYLLNKLQGDELAAFEQKMADNPEFKQHVVQYGETILGIQQVAANDLNASIKASIAAAAVTPDAYEPSQTPGSGGRGSSSIVKKIISFLVIGGMIAAAVYTYLNKDDLKQRWEESKQKIESEIQKVTTTTDTIITLDGKEVTDPELKKRLMKQQYGSDTVSIKKTIQQGNGTLEHE